MTFLSPIQLARSNGMISISPCFIRSFSSKPSESPGQNQSEVCLLTWNLFIWLRNLTYTAQFCCFLQRMTMPLFLLLLMWKITLLRWFTCNFATFLRQLCFYWPTNVDLIIACFVICNICTSLKLLQQCVKPMKWLATWVLNQFIGITQYMPEQLGSLFTSIAVSKNWLSFCSSPFVSIYMSRCFSFICSIFPFKFIIVLLVKH